MSFFNKKKDNPNPRLKANIFSKLTLWWTTDILLRKRNIEPNDIYDPLPADRSDTLSNALEVMWNKEMDEAKQNKREPRLLKAIVKVYISSFLKKSCLTLCSCIIAMLQPLALKALVSSFHEDVKSTLPQVLIYATLVIVTIALQTFVYRHVMIEFRQIGMRVTKACSSLIYRKILRLPYLTINQQTGTISNLISTDVAQFDMFFMSLSYAIFTPLIVAVVTYLLWQDFGWITLVGIASMIILSLPVQATVYKLSRKMRSKLTAKRDERISWITEIVHGVLAIKINVWEKSFKRLARVFRRYEVKYHLKIAKIYAIGAVSVSNTKRASAYLTILVYTLLTGTITADKIIFVCEQLFTLQTNLLYHSSQCVQLAAELSITVKRMQKFLLLEEVHPYIKYMDSTDNGRSIFVNNITANWKKESNAKNVLQDINVEINSKKLYTLTGPVGSGKSTFLKLILGELPPVSGEISIQGVVSYVSQEPWLFPASIRENILLGEKYDEEKYNRVVKVCALTTDFNLLPYGDRTLVGENGTALSGGQCARVNLARAVYKDADIYLMDDCLSAVDSHVSKAIFEDCITGYLKEKTRIFVTHNIEYLKDSDGIILIKNGRVDFMKTLTDLQKIENQLYFLPADFEKSAVPMKQTTNKLTKNSVELSISKKEREVGEKPAETEELIAKGYVEKSVYWTYVKASKSLHFLVILIIIFALHKAVESAFDYWLLYWAKTPYNNTMYICGILLVSLIILTFVIFLLHRFIFLRASENIHNDMISCVLSAPIQFFEANDVGIILNRFSKDIGIADEKLNHHSLNTASTLFYILLALILIAFTKWWAILPLFILIFIVVKLLKISIFMSQNFSRLEGTAMSPVQSITSSTITGLVTVRSCKAEKIFANAFDWKQDYHTGVFYLSICVGIAIEFFLQLLVLVYLIFIVYGCIALRNQVFASDIAYLLSQLLNIRIMLVMATRSLAEMLGLITSVERMIQFTEIKSENSMRSEAHTLIPSKLWPDKGEIKFDRLFLYYTEDSEPTLRNINITIKPRTKVGIVGRTGAGKSSLIAALFRLAKFEGSLIIDDINIETIDTSHLRSKISIIPQEPFLFSATLRNNLDPLSETDDAAIWSALEDVELKQSFATLDHPIEKGGRNLSLGQRQLLCLARVILKKNRILVLDEATANIDTATDALIQKTIRRKFVECTVIMIAHKLSTVMDNDKILVLDQGEVVEYDHPYLLLKKGDGYFLKMVEGLGQAASDHLKIIAKQAYLSDTA